MGKGILTTILTVTIAVICVATILVPTLSDATKTEETFTNEGLYNYGVFESTDTDTYTLVADLTDPTTIIVNGEEMTNPLGTNATSYSLVSSEDFLIRYGYTTGGVYQITVVGLQSSNTTIRMYMSTMTATASEGVLTVTGTNASSVEQTATFSYGEIYAIVPDEDEAVMKVPTSDAYIMGNSPIYASGLTTVSQWSDMFHFEGTYDDGITISSPNLPGATFDNIVWNIEEVNGYEDLYKLTSIEFDITYNETTVHATYSYFAVPTEVTAELSQHLTDAENNIIMVIPVLMICAILITAVGMLYFRNRD